MGEEPAWRSPLERLNMPRLLIHVEGETEETFVQNLLVNHLTKFGWESVSARLMGNARLRQRRGGIRSWSSVRLDVVKTLREDSGAVAALMVDYYALPRTGEKAWPGRNEAEKLPFAKKAPSVIAELRRDLGEFTNEEFDQRRFVPYIMMHEFEALLFSDCAAFSKGIHQPLLRDSFQKIRDGFETPEMINDSPLTAPSKRIIGLIPNYEKPLLGTLGILEIGIDRVREQCPHFNEWLTQLENAANNAS